MARRRALKIRGGGGGGNEMRKKPGIGVKI
jgi:hypothetical protein